MKVVFLTAGAAGMYCGSCLHDNALARAMIRQGVDCVLQPVYTPIRVDGESVASKRVFFGGIHVYLLQQLPWLRLVPGPLRKALDWPPLIRWATRRSQSTDAAKLGALTESMLSGLEGRQSDEVQRLVDWLCDEMKPDAVVLSNLLIGGALPEIRRRLPQAKLLVILQGDDIFLDHLPAESRAACITHLQRLIGSLDRVLVNSQFYADKMGQLLSIPSDKLVVAPLSIDTQPFQDSGDSQSLRNDNEFRLGYFARIAPEKGLHRLVDAFIELAKHPDHADLSLQVAGWLGEANREYLATQQAKLESAGLTDRFVYHGSPDLAGKVDFLRSLDLLSVPTDYEEPKGLFVLESLASGVPVVQPNHGAFGELIAQTGGGIVVTPGDPSALAEGIALLKANAQQRMQLSQNGRKRVHEAHSIEAAAQHLCQLIESIR